MEYKIFTYGSLMFSEVWQAVTGTKKKNQHAILKQYGRYKVKGDTYPGIVPMNNSFVKGVVYYNIAFPVIQRLDAFEGKYYYRKEVFVSPAHQPSLKAFAFIIKPEYFHILSDEKWSPEWFLKFGLRKFLGSYG